MSRRRFILAVALVVLAGGALRLALAAQRPLWIDEVLRLAWSHGCNVADFDDVTSSMLCINKRPGGVADVVRVTAGFEPLLNDLLLNRWMHLSGARSDLAIRVPLVAFSVLGLVGMALLGRELGGERLGLAVVTLVALSPLHVYYGGELNNYALACCLVIFSYLFYFRLLRDRSALNVAWYILCTMAALLTHYYTLLVFGAQCVAVPFAVGAAPRRLVKVSLPFVLVALGLAAYLPVLLQQLPYLLSVPSGDFGGLEFLGRWLRGVPLYPWLWELAGIIDPRVALVGVAAVVALLLTGLRAIPDRRRRMVLAINIFAPIAAIAAAYLVRRNNQILWPRYGLFSTVPALLATAALWARPRWGPVAWIGAVVTAVLLGTGLHFVFRGGFHNDWRQAATTISSDGDPNDEVIVIHQPNLVYALGRYLPPAWRLYGVSDAPTVPLDVALEGRTSVWAVFAWDDGTPERARIWRVLKCRFGAAKEYAYPGSPGITLLHLSGGATPAPQSCGPASGFDRADGGCWALPGASALQVQGWVATGIPAAIDVLVDGKEVVSADVLQAADGSVQQRAGEVAATRFARDVDIGTIPDGTLFWLGVRDRAANASQHVGPRALPCVKRSRVAMEGTAGPAWVDGFIDVPRRLGHLERGQRLLVTGWAASTRGITEIALLVDGREHARSRQHGYARPDVRDALPDFDAGLVTYSGFLASVDTTGLQPGVHVLTVATVHPDGSLSPIGPRRRFEIVAAP